MCGIVGYTGSEDQLPLEAMNRVQRHRGPDEAGARSFLREQVHLASRRLAIIDLPEGQQPMTNEDESLCLVFNGEIFNAPELRRGLEARGVRFRTDHSDTEVLLKLYEEKQDALLDDLIGMFAFVIFDRSRGLLFGARDHFGIKPLHYHLNEGRFSFASEVKSLLSLPWTTTDLDHQAMYDFLTFQAIAAPHTIYKDIHKIPAAHCFHLRLDSHELRIKQYWRPRFSTARHTYQEHVHHVREEFTRAVKRWCISDVPLACSLSGGIDSSSLVAIASREAGSIGTYTLGFNDAPELDERRLARLVAERWGTRHHEIIIDQDDLLDQLPKMLQALDEPYAGGLPSWFVYEAMSEEVKVGLVGSGGDELFSNYDKWRKHESPLLNLKMKARYLKHGGRVGALLRYPQGALHYPYFTDARKETLFSAEVMRSIRPSAQYLQALWDQDNATAARDRVPNIDLQLQLPEEFLLMTDRFSMSHSLEARTPFLDKTFVEAILSIPARTRVDGHVPKRLFIDAFRELIPAELLTAKKRGFVLPETRWMRGRLRPMVQELLGTRYLKKQGIFDTGLHGALVAPFLRGDYDQPWQVWTLLSFQMWFEAVYEKRDLCLTEVTP